MRCDWESATHGLARLVELAAFTKQFKLKEYVKAYNLNETDAAALEEYCSEAVNARSFLHYMPWSWRQLVSKRKTAPNPLKTKWGETMDRRLVSQRN